jgi:hypothetical protein
MPLQHPALRLVDTVHLKHQRLVFHQLAKPLAGLQAVATIQSWGFNPQNPDLHQTGRSRLGVVQSRHDGVAVQDQKPLRVLAGYGGQADQDDQ